ncbi:MAG: hypothetical protein IJP88_07635 [Synergistaceae bacterium]|nr:hypothetical protein [Synergistaceae bacterium]
MSDKLSGENKDGFIKKLYKISVKVITLFLCGLAIYVIYSVGSFLFNWNSSGGVVQWGVLKIGGLILSMFIYVLSITFPYIFPPIIVYLLLEVFLRKLPYIMRWGAELGCTYIFYLLSGLINSNSGIIQWMLLAFQVYFLFILVMPQEFMGIIGCIASMVVSMIVFILPDMPGAYDDVAAICTVMAVIFGYINTLAVIIKRRLVPLFIKIFK